jgi:hypothetical protein
VVNNSSLGVIAKMKFMRTRNRIFLMFALFVLITLVISCGQRKPIDTFFRSVDKTLTKEEKSSIDSCQQTECWIGLAMIIRNVKFRQLFDSAPANVIATMDTNKIQRYRGLCLFIAYCKNRANQQYDFIQILGEIDKYNHHQELIAHQDYEMRRVELTKIADSSYQRIQLRDTIMLNCPTEYINEKWRSYALKTLPGDQILNLKCLVLNKWLTPYPNDSTDHPIFGLKIKILDFDRQPCEFQFKDIKKGSVDNIDIYIKESAVEIL